VLTAERMAATTGKEEIVQEFYNHTDHQELLLYNPQQTGTVMNSVVGLYGRVEKVSGWQKVARR